MDTTCQHRSAPPPHVRTTGTRGAVRPPRKGGGGGRARCSLVAASVGKVDNEGCKAGWQAASDRPEEAAPYLAAMRNVGKCCCSVSCPLWLRGRRSCCYDWGRH